MKRFTLLAASALVLLAGCAASGTQEGAQRAGVEESYVPTGSMIARRNVDRNSAVKSASKEELENARLLGGGALNLPQN